MLPIENTTAGSVYESYDLLLRYTDKHPEVIATSSEKGMGIAELRAAVREAVES